MKILSQRKLSKLHNLPGITGRCDLDYIEYFAVFRYFLRQQYAGPMVAFVSDLFRVLA